MLELIEKNSMELEQNIWNGVRNIFEVVRGRAGFF